MRWFCTFALLTWLQSGTALPSFRSIEARLQKLEDFVDRMKVDEEIGAEMDGTAMMEDRDVDLITTESGVEPEALHALGTETDGTAVEDRKHLISEESVVEKILVVSGCDRDVATYMTDYFKSLTGEFSQPFTSIQVTCGLCSTLSLKGMWSGLVTLCKSQKGTVCIRQIQKATCLDRYPGDDTILPISLPVDGMSKIAVVNLVVKNDSKQCFTLENPSAYATC